MWGKSKNSKFYDDMAEGAYRKEMDLSTMLREVDNPCAYVEIILTGDSSKDRFILEAPLSFLAALVDGAVEKDSESLLISLFAAGRLADASEAAFKASRAAKKRAVP